MYENVRIFSFFHEHSSKCTKKLVFLVQNVIRMTKNEKKVRTFDKKMKYGPKSKLTVSTVFPPYIKKNFHMKEFDFQQTKFGMKLVHERKSKLACKTSSTLKYHGKKS